MLVELGVVEQRYRAVLEVAQVPELDTGNQQGLLGWASAVMRPGGTVRLRERDGSGGSLAGALR